MMKSKHFALLLAREWLVYIRKPSQILNPLLFFCLMISLFPMGMSLESATLQKVAPGLVWMGFLLASLLSMDRIFYYDFESGILEQQLISSISILKIIYAKLLVLWIFSVMPLILIMPIVGLMYNLSFIAVLTLIGALLCGTPIISVLLVILAALVLGAANRNALISLIFLPMSIPVLIFGSGSVLLVMQGLNGGPVILILLGIALICLTLGPYLVRHGLYLSVE